MREACSEVGQHHLLVALKLKVIEGTRGAERVRSLERLRGHLEVDDREVLVVEDGVLRRLARDHLLRDEGGEREGHGHGVGLVDARRDVLPVRAHQTSHGLVADHHHL
eukprot:scaffold118613_cov69-Phaeocystis_antarctica.AAC.1